MAIERARTQENLERLKNFNTQILITMGDFMKRVLRTSIMFLCFSLSIFAAQAQAQSLQASMSVTQAKDAFIKVDGVDLQLINNTNMNINLRYDDGDTSYNLKVFDIQQDQEGCTKYRAKLDRPESEERINGFWFFVDLVDNSSCTGEKEWQAFVRSGCRCCNEDSTMTLMGKYERI